MLENHHAATAVALLQRPELDFLCLMSSQEKVEFIKVIQNTVLATDVTTTMPMIKEFQGLVEQKKEPTPDQLMSMLIKAADISNPARHPFIYQQWIEGVMTEFFQQGDAEKQLSLPVSMNCDRDTVNVAITQTGARVG